MRLPCTQAPPGTKIITGAGSAGRSSRRHTSSSCDGRGPYCTEDRWTLRRCSRSFHSGGTRSGAGHSMSRSLAGTTPRSAASVTAFVLSRSARFCSAIPGAKQRLRRRAEEVGHVADAPDAHRGDGTKRLKVFPDHRQRRRRHAHRQHVVGRAGLQQPSGACPHCGSGVPGVRSCRHCATVPRAEFP